MSLRFTQTYNILASGTQTITTAEEPHLYLASVFHVTVTGAGGSIDFKTKQGSNSAQTTQVTIAGDSGSAILDLVNVYEVSLVETLGVAVTVVLSGE